VVNRQVSWSRSHYRCLSQPAGEVDVVAAAHLQHLLSNSEF
jgi:hypothetical protein